jgi:hypothetical protein
MISTRIRGATAAANPLIKPFCKNALRSFFTFKVSLLLTVQIQSAEILRQTGERVSLSFNQRASKSSSRA